ncbi:LiaG family protein [Neobacillus dielmonensis]|uniref:LiaG family protein n=1 Tax=Neobacillus dielmonensis TaxID=1347369 RepID=UPI0005A7F588|nr:DUF4097 family beta strand repeat-containing protein [Neobacillus dielmonensis]
MKRILILLLVITGLYIIVNPPIHFDLWNAKRANGQAEISTDTQTITLDVSSASTTIIPEKRSNVKAVYNGKQKLQVKDTGDAVEIHLKNNWFDWFNWGPSKSKLTIYIPANYKGDMDIELGSGSLQFFGPESAPMKLDHVTVEIGSGRMDLKNLEVNQLQQDVSSGAVKLDTIKANSGTFDVSSGKLDIKHYKGAVKADVASGLFTIQMDQLTDSVTMDVSSGKVNVDLPKNADFTLESDISSGNISCDFPLSEKESSNNHLKGKHGSGKYKLNLDVSSGNIHIF